MAQRGNARSSKRGRWVCIEAVGVYTVGGGNEWASSVWGVRGGAGQGRGKAAKALARGTLEVEVQRQAAYRPHTETANLGVVCGALIVG